LTVARQVDQHRVTVGAAHTFSLRNSPARMRSASAIAISAPSLPQRVVDRGQVQMPFRHLGVLVSQGIAGYRSAAR